MTNYGRPIAQGLYRPESEHENCGVGFVADIRGNKNNRIVKQGLDILKNLKHRGAIGADGSTGDGSGILIQIPHDFLNEEMNYVLPEPGEYAVGMMFLPMEPNARLYCEGVVERIIKEEGQSLIGWRDVPVNEKEIGDLAQATRPVIAQVFIRRDPDDHHDFQTRLLMIRKRMTKEIASAKQAQSGIFYACSLSDRTLIYKGLVLGYKLDDFYLDLRDSRIVSAIAVVHERYSTNSFPSWELAQPFRGLAHNGEINTITGNINWMNAREGVLKSRKIGEDFPKIFPIIEPNGSDSASLDNAWELLVANGHPVEQALMMLIPEPWQSDMTMDPQLRGFYEYSARLLEPWDGPATIVFTDGKKIGAVLDRNGLRPARYLITRDHTVIMASETGVLPIPDEEVVVKRLVKPREMLLIDTEKGLIVPSEMIKQVVSHQKPFAEWVERNRIDLKEIKEPHEIKKMRSESYNRKKNIFGYSDEEFKWVIDPMITAGKESIGSMGNAIPIAPLSKKPQLLFNYFKQNFAQVTNPPIDPIRERNIMSLEQYAGPRGPLLDEFETDVDRPYLRFENPILSTKRLEDIRHLDDEHFRSLTLPMTFIIDQKRGLEKALEHLCRRAEESVLEGYNIIVLSDRSLGRYHAAIPSLLATSAVHHHLIRKRLRTSVDIFVEAGDARDVMHMALLVGYGAKAINPYMIYDYVAELAADETRENVPDMDVGFSNYCHAISEGLLKVLSRMGIATLQSYSGAQRFQALGINSSVIDAYFSGTPSSIEGIGLDEISDEVVTRHMAAYQNGQPGHGLINQGGEIFYRKQGENHILDPQIVKLLGEAARSGDAMAYHAFAEAVFKDVNRIDTLRGLFELKLEEGISLDSVQSQKSILETFFIGGMSFGSLSKPAHESIAVAMNRIGAKSNSGEGGEDPARYLPQESGDSLRSAIKQVASGRFGVTTEYLVNCDEIEIKVAQGAKPGEGGHLPGSKVTVEIAKVRHSTPGIDLVSPPPHHDIYSIEDLAQLIFDLKNVNPKARIGVKLVAETGVGTVAAGISKARADFVTISGHDGGTGASPISSMKYVGLPWEIGLAEAQQTLLLNNLRSRITVQVDGKLRTGRDVVIAAILGAERFGFATTALITQGCIMCRQCHQNRCPVGIATQDKDLIEKFSGKPEYLSNYLGFIADEVRELLAQLGVEKLSDLVGRTDLLQINQIDSAKINGLDLSPLLYQPELPSRIAKICTTAQVHEIEQVLDRNLMASAIPALEEGRKVQQSYAVRNTDRAVGAMLSGWIAQHPKRDALEKDQIDFQFRGSAGQSFGAFVVHGVKLTLAGDANDYVGKGLSGGTLVLHTPDRAKYKSRANAIAGNTLLYGATSGNVYISGLVGQRFAVRNSGANAVVEGIGDHGCEYMTGGTVVILGEVGRNFAAGMSGGIAYVFDPEDQLESRCNPQTAQIMEVSDADLQTIRAMIETHRDETDSSLAGEILEKFEENAALFRKVASPEYIKLTRLD